MMADDAARRRIRPAFLRPDEQKTFSENERRLLDLVRQEVGLSRADLARRTGLTLQSIVRLTEGLLDRGFLKYGEKVIRGPGQPSAPLSLVRDAALTFGVSIMTDAMSVVLMDLTGEVRLERHVQVAADDRDGVIQRLRTLQGEMAVAADIDAGRIFGLGVATTGYFLGKGALNTPGSMNQWAGIDLETTLSEALDLPVWLENDGNAAAAGESLYGVGRRHRTFVYMYIAAGLGGGLVRDGVIWRGHRGNAGEFTGILPVPAREGRPTLTLLLSILRARGVALSGIDELVARFDPSWPGVEEWLEATSRALTAVLSAISAVEDPEVIVIGGRAPRALTRLICDRAQFYRTKLRDHERAFPAVVPAETEHDAAALGAASLPLKQHFFV
jgi:predicted NBD/HSP70 family sugar kinase/DNA-binding XRE family transcriptional regulator